jgi:hypothetical protein
MIAPDRVQLQPVLMNLMLSRIDAIERHQGGPDRDLEKN